VIDTSKLPDGCEVWTSGDVTLMRGDCLAVLPAIADGSVEMIFADPPYGHSNADGDFLARRHEIMADGRGDTQQPIANDDQDGMRRVVDGMLREAARILRPDCCCCCCCCGGGGPKPTFAWLAQRMDGDGLSFFHSVIWDKRNPGVGWRYRRQHEMIMVAHRRGGKILWRDEDRKQPNIVSMSKPRTDNHPNEKPVELAERFIFNHAADGATVCDPFMGSGTTGVAAVNMNMRFIGIELDPIHFATARDRISAAINAKSEMLIA
jgi:site-specific DNA-methyltransferase (adenine-specific)